MNPILNCKDVSKFARPPSNPSLTSVSDDLCILQSVDLQVVKGESISIVGQSGSGKTTLLSLLAGLDSPSGGEIYIADHAVHEMSEEQRAALRNQYIGFVFQSFHLLPGFTALENVMLPLEMNGDKQAQEKAKAFLERVGVGHRLNHYPSTLSGGEQQRVAIARAFVANPPLLMADEPTGNLDVETGHQIMDLLFELNREQGTTLVLVTHDSELAQRCQRCLVLKQGQLYEQCTESA